MEPAVDEMNRQLFFPVNIEAEENGRIDKSYWFYVYSPEAKVPLL